MLMHPELWQQIIGLFNEAITRRSKDRIAFLDKVCEGDKDLRQQIERLIKSHEKSENFLESPAFAVAPELLTNGKKGTLVGELIGHYRIESLIGIGGMGEVYLALDERLGRKVALKLLPEYLTADETQLKRFETEARTASALNHPNILTVYEIGTERNRHFIATEFIEGTTLRGLLAHGRLRLYDALEITVQVASALAAAHESGVVHRDIKPENIMLRPDGYAKVLDFGIAKLIEPEVARGDRRAGTTTLLLKAQPGLVIGTAQYMSPEQARGQTADARSDIWSLGVVLYEMVAGNPPFSGTTPSECTNSIFKRDPAPLSGVAPDVPVKLESIVQRALRKDRNERYQSIHEMLFALRGLKEDIESPVSTRKRGLTAALATFAAVLILAGATLYVATRPTPRPGNVSAIPPPFPKKSIAVLPFENLSDDKGQAFFAEGVQDDILTKLAKVADLKVISRSSVMRYRGKQDLRQIGRALGVSHVLEGTVRTVLGKVHINAQLVDTHTEASIWAEEYDRDLREVFAIEAELVQSITNQLKATVSTREMLAIQERLTDNLHAFDLYAQANNLLLAASFSDDVGGYLRQAIDFLNQAVARDPSFFQAYCQLSHAHGRLYFYGHDHTPARLALAEMAVETAFRLRPDAGETHLARAENLYWGYLDYNGALAELEVARRTLPNNARIFQTIGYIQRRRGHWEESALNFERALALNPRDLETLQQIAISHDLFRRYPDEKLVLDHALTIEPNHFETKAVRAFVDLDWKADTGPLHRVISEIRAANPAAMHSIANNWLMCALADRDATGAKAALSALGETRLRDASIQFNHAFVEGLIARMSKDEAKANAAFSAARVEQEKLVRADPNFAPAFCVLGLIDAALGRKEDALREGRRAVELVPVEKDAIRGPAMIKYLAMIAAWLGDKDLACEQLAIAVKPPCDFGYGELKLLPWWDPLRGDPRFEKIVATLAPGTGTNDKSIAVLPFADLSQAHDQEYFCDGIQEEILTRLSKIRDLKVVSRTSTQQFRDAKQSLSDIAKQLGVANLLEGSVQKTNDQVRVNVQLIKAADDSHLWAETYDRRLTDIFSVESEIAAAIADRLQAKLDGFEQRAIAIRPTENHEAHQLYLKGTFFSNKRTGSDLRTAIEYFKGAIAKDANYALAYAGMADAYGLLALYGGEGPKKTAPQAKAAARKALELDETLPEAHNSLGLLLALYDFDFTQSKREFERAIELNPNYATAHHQFGNVNLSMIGEFNRAIAEGSRAVELDPLSLIINADLGQDFMLARRYDEAIEQLRRTLAMDPRFYYARWTLGECLQMKGKLTEALAEYQKAAEITDDPIVMALLAQGYAKTGQRDMALGVLSQLEQLATQRYVGPFTFALIHLALGENERAMDDLERAFRERLDPGIVGIKVEPLLDPLRGHPRFERLLADVVGNAENKSANR